MLTPQEVSDRAFRKASFGGYSMGQVDEFLDVLTSDYTSLYNENAVLKSKLKTMVDKVDEYRSTEDAMRKALMSAQRMADEMVRKAEKRKEEILQQAEAEARVRIDKLHEEYESQRSQLAAAQKSTSEFLEKVKALHEKELEYLAGLRGVIPEPLPPQEEQQEVEDKASEIDSNVQRILANAMAQAKTQLQAEEQDISDTAEYHLGAAPEQQKAAPREEAAARPGGGKFDNLQFGRDYKIQ